MAGTRGAAHEMNKKRFQQFMECVKVGSPVTLEDLQGMFLGTDPTKEEACQIRNFLQNRLLKPGFIRKDTVTHSSKGKRAFIYKVVKKPTDVNTLPIKVDELTPAMLMGGIQNMKTTIEELSKERDHLNLQVTKLTEHIGILNEKLRLVSNTDISGLQAVHKKLGSLLKIE